MLRLHLALAARGAAAVVARPKTHQLAGFQAYPRLFSDDLLSKFDTSHHVPPRHHTEMDGIVVSDKMQKTINVAVTRYRVVPKYNKRQRYTRKFMAHDEDEECRMGDRVRIKMSRPISKKKRFSFVRILERGQSL
mmetsp:Transcript_79634/g.227371  ORF Transcript_79634/g.227371 Transcript_79634/m.227371 type:complete len:135 (+) Transcript_79634:74-478(+)